MPINFLGDKTKPVSKSKSQAPVTWHLPEAEAKKKKEQAKKNKQVVEQADKTPQVKEVNLMVGFRKYLLKRRLIIITILVIIIAGGTYAYFQYLYTPPVPNTNINIPVVTNTNLPPTPPPPEPPPPEPKDPEPGVLPDTELAPLRGALVKFRNESIIYLVEENGELRRVNLSNTVFDNGQSIKQVSSQLIYTIADNFKIIRRGRDVYGQVDWDPRILTSQELQPFIK